MHKKSKKDLKSKLYLIRLTSQDKLMAETLAKSRGESVARFFRNLMKEENDRIKYKFCRDKIEQRNNKLQEMIDAIEKSISVCTNTVPRQ